MTSREDMAMELLSMSLEELEVEAIRLESKCRTSGDMESQIRLSVVRAAMYQRSSQKIYEAERRMAETYKRAKGKSGKVWYVPPKSESQPTRVFYMGRSGKINSANINDMLGDLEEA
ncbi:hypothetical protein F9B85_07620 [Heliorestis acidaminivorans]|uniref:Uncharacterized protein n=1 Tax=Heliorestis acidaminivorans TaxID=553427 RepID=A0A6I0EWK7_9FIRM|nr:hypothetical protein [Heliorestis acidaminivorans]KAB2952527.1 hypothetical protein F9B85_07620 [Heliorestis acidaminivorans]